MTLLKCVNDVELPYVVQLGYRHVSCAPTSNSPLQKCVSSSIYMHECASAVLPVFHFVSSFAASYSLILFSLLGYWIQGKGSENVQYQHENTSGALGSSWD
jgi:hypothetical protein